MKEDVYRKACMRDGAAWLYDRISVFAEADLADEEAESMAEFE